MKDTNRISSAKSFVNFQENKKSQLKVKISKETDFEDLNTELRKLILYNSGHLWDDVINQLKAATGYDVLHCEQIAVIAHTKGKAVGKSGELTELEPINNILKQIKLITGIE